MHSRRTLLVLPVLAMSLILLGMTQEVSAAHSIRTVRSATTGITAIDQLLERVASRTQSRLDDDTDDDDNNDTQTQRQQQSSASSKSSSSSSSRSSTRSSSATAIASDTSLSGFREEVLDLVNAERKKQGLSAYSYNRTLEKSAQQYAEHMSDDSCFSHTACGSTLKERMHASGYYQGRGKSYSYGENIARGQKSAQQVMEDWMNSPSHRAAILSSKFKEIGIGKSGTYWVQHFGAIR